MNLDLHKDMYQGLKFESLVGFKVLALLPTYNPFKKSWDIYKVDFKIFAYLPKFLQPTQ